jgi:Sortase domain
MTWSLNSNSSSNTLNRKLFYFFRNLWILRHRLYSLLTVVIILPFLYATMSNVPPNVSTSGYKVLESNFLAQRIERLKLQLPVVPVATNQLENKKSFDFTALDIMDKLALGSINAGFIDPQKIKDIGYKLPVPERRGEVNEEERKKAESRTGKSLEELIPRPSAPTRVNFISFPKYKINAPIVYSSFDDHYKRDNDGTIDLMRPVDLSDINSPIQKRLEKGVVCLAITPFPGDYGNSYCVGHSSNFEFIQSDYNQVFKAIEKKGNPGEEFFIYDMYGRELKFRVFETKLIDEKDTEEAYKPFPGRRITTLQTSVVSYRPERGLQPYERWLVRGELICPDNNPCKE